MKKKINIRINGYINIDDTYGFKCTKKNPHPHTFQINRKKKSLPVFFWCSFFQCLHNFFFVNFKCFKRKNFSLYKKQLVAKRVKYVYLVCTNIIFTFKISINQKKRERKQHFFLNYKWPPDKMIDGDLEINFSTSSSEKKSIKNPKKKSYQISLYHMELIHFISRRENGIPIYFCHVPLLFPIK